MLYIIGHAVNDVTDDLTQDVLANKMVCYVAQGISKDFSKVWIPQFLIFLAFMNYVDMLHKKILCILHLCKQVIST